MYAYRAGTVRNMTAHPKTVNSEEAERQKRWLMQKSGSLRKRDVRKEVTKSVSEPTKRIKILINVREVLKWSNATPIQSVGLAGYACCYCDEQCPEAAQLKHHTLNRHSCEENAKFTKRNDMNRFYVKLDITELHCKICSENCDNLIQLMNHLQGDHQKKLFLDVINYMVPFKFESDVLRCFICQHKFHGFKTLLEHMNTHCRNFVCKVCDAGFITRSGLKYHSKNHEVGDFGCDFCAKVFTTLTRKKSHEKCVHSGVMLNKCQYCDAHFRYYHEKIKHLLKVHGIAPVTIECQACDQSFAGQKAYRNHMKRDHLLERKYRCTHCEMAFFTSHELKGHTLKHTGLRSFQCDVCLKSYGRKATLREHLRIHADDRRFKCDQCGVAFVARCSWRGHMKRRHGLDV